MTNAQHIRNLLAVYDRGTTAERAEAIASYQRYHDLISIIAQETGHSTRIAVGVFSALSPNNSYVSNLKNCRTLLLAERAGKSMADFKVNTYDSNKLKAWTMARDRVEPLALFRGLKTKAFFLNCLDPLDPDPITVDGHMYWVWMGRKGVVKTRGIEGKRNEVIRRAAREGAKPVVDHGPELLEDVPRNAPRAREASGRSRKVDAPPHLSPTVYAEIADGIRLVGEIRGVIGNQAQAVLWQNWRRMHNVMGSSQLEMMARDVFATGQTDRKHLTQGCGQ